LLLRPRKIKYKSTHKKRTLKHYVNTKHVKLIYGQFGIQNHSNTVIIYNKFLYRLKLFLKKAVRRSNITNRYLWINAFPQIPITKKVIGSRMGKGKGKPSNWAARIPTGLIFIEFKNIRPGRAFYYLVQTKYKLPGSHKIVSKYHINVKLISFKKRSIRNNYYF